MKQYIAFVLCGLLVACSNSTQTKYYSTDIELVYDKTDTLLVQPNANAIVNASGVREHINNSYQFSVTSISALANTPIYTVFVANDSITSKYNTASIPDFRNIVLHQFIKNVEDTIKAFIKDSTIKDFATSQCFATIANTLRKKQFQNADNKFLFVYSDLFEYSELFDIYRHSNTSVVEIVKIFEATNLLPKKLNNFKVYFIYQPKNVIDDKRYTTMIQVYKKLLEIRGAEVLQITKL